MIDLLICHDSDDVRTALRTMLAGHDEIAVAGEAANGEEAVALALALVPDAVLMGLDTPLSDGVEATRRIARLVPEARIVAFSASDDAAPIVAMMEAGADASCVRDPQLWELELAVAGASGPLVRLAHGLAKATHRAGVGAIVSRELVELTGASAAAAYLASPDVALSLAGAAGCTRPDRLAAAPVIALRAVSMLVPVFADDADVRELQRLGIPCGDALALPLVADGEALGALVLAMDPEGGLTAEEDFFSDVAALAAAAFSRVIPARPPGGTRAGAREPADHPPDGSRGVRVLFVDDDPGLLMLLRATFELIDIEIDEAGTTAAAAAAIAARAPDVVVLDIGLPDVDGLTFCRRLKDDPATSWIGIVLLTGADGEVEGPARAAGADALLRKPFSPLELLGVVERLAGGLYEGPFAGGTADASHPQLLLYANDLRRMLEIERGRQELLQRSYRQTVATLASALESKDFGTGSHSQRVQRYAVALAQVLEPRLLLDPSVEYGFLLHDVGKIGIPDHVLQKSGPLDDSELRLMRTHTVLGERMLRGVDLLHGDGLKVVRWHHERWDGLGYPDGLARTEIPLAARIFTVADVLDAITSDRPYRLARSWEDAAAEILDQRGRQFDPDVVDAFREREQTLREIRSELVAA